MGDVGPGEVARTDSLDTCIDSGMSGMSGAELESQSLLSRKEDALPPVSHSQRISTCTAYIHLIAANFGPGCLALPASVARVGGAWATIVFILVAALCLHSSLTLNKLRSDSRHRLGQTFSGLGRLYFGRTGERMVALLLCTLQFSVLCVYIQLVSTNLGVLVPQNWSRTFKGCLALVLVLLSLGMTRVNQMRPLTTAANLIMLVAVVSTIVKAVTVMMAPATPRLSRSTGGLALASVPPLRLDTGGTRVNGFAEVAARPI